MAKPSSISNLKGKRNRFLCPPFVDGIALFGTVFTRTKELADSVNKSSKINTSFKCHEMIHVKQAVSTKDSWLLFYILYIWQWLCNLPLIFKGLSMPYRFIAFELEAYINDNNFTYPSAEGGCVQWRKLNKINLSTKKKLATSFKKQKASFKHFIRRAIDVDTL